MELPEEQNKLKEIAAGNVEAFEHLFFQYQPRLVNFLIGLTHDKEVSRDMAQDLFLSLWKDREKLKNVRFFFLLSIPDGAFYRVRLFRPSHCLGKIYERIPAGCLPSRIRGRNLVRPRAAIDHQPYGRAHVSPAKQIYRMSREEGLSNDEIAKRLDISKRTVENHLTAALAILRKVLYLFFLLHT